MPWTFYNASGQRLSSHGDYKPGGTDVAVADGGTNLSSYSVGDVVYASGATVLAKLAKPGSPAGEVLTFAACATAPSWAAAPGGNLVLLASTETSGTAAAVEFTNLSATYESYLMVLNAQGTTDGAAWGIRLGCSSALKSGGSDYEWAQAHFLSSTCAYSDNEDPNDCNINFFAASGNCGDEGIAATLWLHTDGDCSAHPVVTGTGVGTYCSGVMTTSLFGGVLHTSVAVTRWEVKPSSGDFADGSRVTLYGLKHT